MAQTERTISAFEGNAEKHAEPPQLWHIYPGPRPHNVGSVAYCGFVKQTPQGRIGRRDHPDTCVVCLALTERGL